MSKRRSRPQRFNPPSEARRDQMRAAKDRYMEKLEAAGLKAARDLKKHAAAQARYVQRLRAERPLDFDRIYGLGRKVRASVQPPKSTVVVLKNGLSK